MTTRPCIRFCLLLLLATTNCQNAESQQQQQQRQKEPVKEPSDTSEPSVVNLPPSQPSITIERTDTAGDEVYLAVNFAEKSTDAEGDPIEYHFAWFRNDEAVSFAATQSDIVVRQPKDERTGPFESQIDDDTWRVIVTPIDPYGEGETSSAKTAVHFERHCEPFSRGYVVVDCDDFYSFTVQLEKAITPHKDAKLLVLKNITNEHMLAVEGTDKHERVVNFVDLLLKTWIHKPTLSKLPHDPDTYRYTGPVTGASQVHLFRKALFDVPLIGVVVLNGYLFDNDNDPSFRTFRFGPLDAQSVYQLDASEVTSADYGEVFITGEGAGEYEVSVVLKNVHLDLLFEPPTDPTVEDCVNDDSVLCAGEAYRYENDLSNYVKAYGDAFLGSSFVLDFTVSVPDSFDKLVFDLRTLRVPDSEFEFIFTKGPYCTTNLGVTETPQSGASHSK